MTTALSDVRPIGEQLRAWRQLRRLSQLELASEADVSTRHLSFVETGRSAPSREMVLRLAEHLDVPLRDRNLLLVAAGYAPVFDETPIEEPRMDTVRAALRQVLEGHEPYPAVVVDRFWNLIDANGAAAFFMEGAPPELLEPPLNVLRLSMHPDGMAGNILNLAEWRAHMIDRVRRHVALTADAALAQLYKELRSFPGDVGRRSRRPPATRCSCRCGCGWRAGSCRSSAPSRRSGRRSTSRWRSWRSSRSTRRTGRRPTSCASAPACDPGRQPRRRAGRGGCGPAARRGAAVR
ncbi:helix-turn-helix domain-containing protein [Actinomadura madurae]|uniref:helix-turn-helix domain-containing protein n=1 Tax=Actinomadura madurae TaxID=1993 RepID=UPI0027E2AC76|nr:helix-turn-helix transcriptional regulator [Actinomadura madurae]